ncbi:hypothetical protein THTE_4467 [Thermogutta terrifontis]|uniref:Uncharacterized protein n=1 Tax=Thermogutta terrifontis TaxID=1331910 RepID=A0A286RM77_9BACT|nr:hypothetical protein THTE_4467 [Thermogutta terrifontis]
MAQTCLCSGHAGFLFSLPPLPAQRQSMMFAEFKHFQTRLGLG